MTSRQRTNSTPSRPPASDKPRGFQINVIADPHRPDRYGIGIAETNGTPDNTRTVATVRPADLARLTDTIHQALRESGRPVTAVNPSRKKPVPIDESAGVRLALAARSVDPIRRRPRARAVLDGIAAMSDEETYYWYAKTTHSDTGNRALRALRLLLADDQP